MIVLVTTCQMLGFQSHASLFLRRRALRLTRRLPRAEMPFPVRPHMLRYRRGDTLESIMLCEFDNDRRARGPWDAA